jgi:hypothetical protein
VSPTSLLPPALRWLPLGLALLLGACSRDEGPARLAEAQRKYADLVERGIPPRDAAWDPVFTQLESIPQDSKAYPVAEQRLKLLRELRSTRLPRRPLSIPGEPDGGSPSLDEHGH